MIKYERVKEALGAFKRKKKHVSILMADDSELIQEMIDQT